MMRLSSRARSIITEARRVAETTTSIKKVNVIIVQPGEEPPPQPVDEGVVPLIIRLSDETHPAVGLWNE